MSKQNSRKIAANTGAVLCLALISQNAFADSYVVRWPTTVLPANEDMRIYELHITLKCGYIKAVNNLPDDWSLEITRPVSGISELHAEAGHGISRIASMAEFNDVIKVSYQPEDIGCFKLSATIIRSGPEVGIELEKKDLVLVPVP